MKMRDMDREGLPLYQRMRGFPLPGYQGEK
jgi:hypothetical protein